MWNSEPQVVSAPQIFAFTNFGFVAPGCALMPIRLTQGARRGDIFVIHVLSERSVYKVKSVIGACENRAIAEDSVLIHLELLGAY